MKNNIMPIAKPAKVRVTQVGNDPTKGSAKMANAATKN
jgi:hypothetical protein